MQVLMVTREWAADRRYGLGKSLAPIMDHLAMKGVEVSLVCQEDIGERSQRWMTRLGSLLKALERQGIARPNITALAYGLVERLNMGRLAAKVSKAENYTHVHCHDYIIAKGFKLFRGLSGRAIRWGVTEHGFGSYTQALHEDGAPLSSWMMRRLRAIERAVLSDADWVICATETARAALARDLSAYPTPGHWHRIPHARPLVTRMTRMDARRRLEWDTAAFHVLAVGRLAPLKNFGSLIRAFSRAAPPSARLTIVGSGDAAALHRIASEHEAEDRVRFAVTDDVSVYYAAADLYVSTSLTESFGLANLEALAAGLPAICTTAGAVPEVVADAALLIPPDDDMALAQALRRMIARSDLRASYARRALQRARSWPTAAEVADRYLACYQGRDAETCRPSDSLTSGTIPLTTAWAHHVDGLSHCPLPQPLQLPTDASVLVIAPHPDDETLACGGAIAKLRQRDCIVRVVFLTDGALGDPEHHFDTDIKAARYQEALAALQILDVTETVQLDRADGGLSADESLALRLHHLFQTFSPELVLIPPLLDQHRDHVAASLASLEAWRLSGLRPRVAMWELWQPLPVNRVVDITDVFELRHRASQAYRIPLHYCDYSASAAALARYRSLYLAAADYAEGFLELDPKTLDVELDRLLALRLDIEPSTAAPPAPP